MNFAAVFSFLHPMLTVLITSGIVLYILKKDYSVVISDEKHHSVDSKSSGTIEERAAV